MIDAGEELTGSYLKYVLNCDFVEYHTHIKFIKGEINVVGIDLEKKIVYLCEVVTHLEGGMQYVKNGQPDNVDRLIKKFSKDIEYAKRNFSEYKHIFMLWSPIIRIPKKKDTKHNQMRDIKQIQNTIEEKFNMQIKIVINEEYLYCIRELKHVATRKTEAMSGTIMRFLQIDEKIKEHVDKLKK